MGIFGTLGTLETLGTLGILGTVGILRISGNLWKSQVADKWVYSLIR